MDRDAFKRALGCWATGVAVVTTRVGEQVHGMTVTAFSSVSLDPPLILICTKHQSYTGDLINTAAVFNVNILSAGQGEISDRFAGRHAFEDRFEGIPYEAGELGCPVILGTVATIECAVVQVVVAGDHALYIGEVKHTRTGTNDPLLYYQNGYKEIVFGRRNGPPR